jgi:hypothetical protein
MTTFEGPAMTDPLILGNLLSQIGRALRLEACRR